MIHVIVHTIVTTVFRVTLRILGRWKKSGVDNVPSTGPLLYCPNHVSDSDPAVVVTAIPREAWFIGKSELFENWFTNWLFRAMHGLPIKRDSADRAALRRIEDLLKRGEPVVIFPEGRCSQTGKLQKIQPGAALMSIRTGAPIVPIGLMHTADLLPYGTAKPRRTKDPVTIEFGKPIYPSEFDALPKGDRVDALTKRLGEEIAKLTNQPPPAFERESVSKKKIAVDEDQADAA